MWAFEGDQPTASCKERAHLDHDLRDRDEPLDGDVLGGVLPRSDGRKRVRVAEELTECLWRQLALWLASSIIR